MGTQYHISITLHTDSPKDSKDHLKKQIDHLLVEINQQMSTYINDSEISQFNRYAQIDWFPVSNDFAFVTQAALDISQQTKGAFDITVSPFIDLWGFGSKTQYTPPSKEQLINLMPYVGYRHLKINKTQNSLQKDTEKLRIDLSAIAKGFAVDKISQFLKHKGYKNHLVEIGGEVRATGKNTANKDWQIAIEQPGAGEEKVNRILTLRDKAVATSGDYRNYFIKDNIRYSHTIDPKTGAPVKHNLASVTVLHESTMYADAYATALMVMGEIDGKTFALKHNLKVNMIIRVKNNHYKTWSNFN